MKTKIATVADLLEYTNCTQAEMAAMEGISPPTAGKRKIWEIPSLDTRPEDSDHQAYMKNAIRWRMSGSGPISELGGDEQRQKRLTQDSLNRRIAEALVHNPGLKGGILLLAGQKLQLAIQPYIDMRLGSGIISCEKNPLIYKRQVSQYLDLKLPDTVKVYNIDIFKAVKELIKNYPSYWKGFDLDFDSCLDADKTTLILNILKTSEAESLWIRLATTIRPLPAEETDNRTKALLRDIQKLEKWDLEDLATGPVFCYCDTSPMAVTQVILSRR